MGEVDDYLAGLDPDTARVLGAVYARALELVPEAEQGTGYGMPALRYRGKPLVSAIATKRHLSLFPFSGAVVAAVAGELDGFDLSKGTIRFTGERPLPEPVVTRLVELRRAEIDG
ncbi:MAG TPA: DUF1801 domain-containing protein [Gaiella sp.]|nr:DUF1801 domain-containing protein [Gaiella sp.]